MSITGNGFKILCFCGDPQPKNRAAILRVDTDGNFIISVMPHATVVEQGNERTVILDAQQYQLTATELPKLATHRMLFNFFKSKEARTAIKTLDDHSCALYKRLYDGISEVGWQTVSLSVHFCALCIWRIAPVLPGEAYCADPSSLRPDQSILRPVGGCSQCGRRHQDGRSEGHDWQRRFLRACFPSSLLLLSFPVSPDLLSYSWSAMLRPLIC